MARLVTAIEHNHGVTPDQVAVALASRNPIFDSLVVLLFIPLYGCATWKACDEGISADLLPEAILFR
jgi:hypothetical protein